MTAGTAIGAEDVSADIPQIALVSSVIVAIWEDGVARTAEPRFALGD
jgi:hypothetical protein